MNLFDAIINDPNIAAEYRRQFDRIVHPQSNLLVRRAHTQSERRFTDEPMTGFGGIDEIGSDRWNEVRDQEGADHDREDHRAAVERGE